MITTISYYLVLPLIYLISALPFKLLYLLSDFFYFLLFHVLGYRKKVVYDNLKNSFPEKSDDEINLIAKRYYKYLCDLFLETFKTLTISKKKMLKRCYIDDETLKLFNTLADNDQSTILVLGHYGNWEWAGNTFSILCQHQLYVIYHPLRNKHFDGLMYKMRTRFGTKLIPMKETFRQMLSSRKELNMTAFIADQTPSPNNAYWTYFLNQDTPVFKGTEIIASKIGYPIVYATVNRVKRGYYKISAEVLVNDPKQTIEGQISELHTRRLEKDIINNPEIWLWSHRRWKHKRK